MLELKAQIRTEKAKKVRREGKIPGVLYGPGIENLNVKVDEKEFEKILKNKSPTSLLKLKVENNKEYLVLIKEIQRHPITEKIIHVDFFQPSLKEKIETKVPIIFEGEAPALKLGGTLLKAITEIEIRGVFEKLPKEIRVDLSKLKSFEDAIFVSDLKVPAEVEILRSKNDIVAKILPPESSEEKPLESQ